MKNETKEQRQERKDMFLSRVLSMSKGMVEDEKALIKEAEEKFDLANPIQNANNTN